MKGGKPNNAGRTIGVQIKVTDQIRELFSRLVTNNIEHLQTDIKQLELKDRIKKIIEMAMIVLPTQKLMEFQNSVDNFKPIEVIVCN